MTAHVSFNELLCADNRSKIGLATLDNANSLNALTFDMLAELHDKLGQWQSDDSIVCVMLEGAGEKSFCAGGDVRTMYHVMKEKSDTDIQSFCTRYFTLEYQCDFLIHTYSKPIIAWGDGIVMGGGMGLFMGASHKVVTQKARLAMPEVTIGLYPDVGATWFLNRLEPGIGLFLGLTGASVNATDAMAVKLADHFLTSEQKSSVLQELQQQNWQEGPERKELVSQILNHLSQQVIEQSPNSHLMPFFSQIQTACSGEELAQVVQNICAIDGQTPWLDAAKQTLQAGSPITAKICFRQVTQCQKLSLADCFRLELNLSVQSSVLGEFQEGVRARLIDKDNQPHWQYGGVAEVDEKVIDNLFQPLWPEESHPLVTLGDR